MLVKPMQPPVRQAERGASLVEVLVSILVISFGILAMAAVQSNSVRFQKTSEYRATANLLTSEMADRMRANASGVSADAYRWNSASYAALTSSDTGTAPSCGTVTGTTLTPCSASQLATQDLVEWKTRVLLSLPGASGHIGAYDATSKALDLWVAWRDPEEADRSGNTRTPASAECPPSTVWTASNTVYHCVFLRVAL